MPPRAAHDWPSTCSSDRAVRVERGLGERLDLVGRQQPRAHALQLGERPRPRRASSMMQVCSAGQITDASKVFEISMSTTAIGTSALRWT